MAVLCGLLVFSGPAGAGGTVPVRPDLRSAGWEMLRFRGLPETAFRTTADGAVEVRAEKSSSVLYLKIADEPVPVKQLSWDWQVMDGVAATDLSRTDGDDRSLSVYVAFSDGSMASKLKSMVSPLAAGHVLNYVWGGAAPLDIAHPHFPTTGRLIVKRTASAATGTWLSESVDLEADYLRAFGEAMPGLAYIGISGDSDDTGVTSRGLIRNLRWE